MKKKSLKRAYGLTMLSLLCVGQTMLWAQAGSTSDSQTSNANKSWTETSEQHGPSTNLNPMRTVESHTQRDGRRLDKQSLERLGADGRYEPYLDTEKETIRLDATTVRTVERTFGRGPDGQKALVQLREEETRTLSGGERRVVRTTSNPDVNGRFQVVQRQLQEIKQSSPGMQETKTTIMNPNLDGSLVPTVRVEERNTRTGDHTFESRKSTLVPDANGGWQVSEVREGLVTEGSNKSLTKDERVLRPGSDGKLALVERTVSKEVENAPGEKRQTVESYSTDVPGGFGDGNLQLNQRITTVRRAGADGVSATEQQVEQRNLAAPGEAPRLTQKTIDIVRPGLGGTASETRTVESLNADGDLGVVWVDTHKLETAPVVQVDTKKGGTGPVVNVDTKAAKPK